MFFTRTQSITPQDAQRRLKAGEILLVDVREPSEVAAGRVKGALTIPLGELQRHLPELQRGKPVAFLCRSGARSARATKAAARAGLDAMNVTGGIAAWDRAGLPVKH